MMKGIKEKEDVIDTERVNEIMEELWKKDRKNDETNERKITKEKYGKVTWYNGDIMKERMKDGKLKKKNQRKKIKQYFKKCKR